MKKNEVNEKEVVKFLDKTDLSWYASKKESKVTICESIDEIIDGKGETYEYSRLEKSARSITKNEKTIQKCNFVLSHLVDGSSLLLRPWKELK